MTYKRINKKVTTCELVENGTMELVSRYYSYHITNTTILQLISILFGLLVLILVVYSF